MKSVRRMHAILVSVGWVTSGWAFAEIKGSKHDFTAAGGDACSACHVSHPREPAAAAPLWQPKADLNRRFGTGPATRRWTGPGSGTLSCLRCHDGTLARQIITGINNVRYTPRYGLAPRSAWSRGHGASNHPVGVRYPQIQRGYRPMSSVLAGGAVVLPDGRVECVSCHDPHNEAGVDKMLVMRDDRSALCLTCHKK